MRLTAVPRAVGVAMFALALTGCVKMDLALTVHQDDTVDGSIILALDKEQIGNLAEMEGGDEDAMVEDLEKSVLEELPEGATAEPYDEGGFVGTKVTFTDAPISEFQEDGFGIVHEGDEFKVTMLATEETSSETNTDLPPETQEGLDSMMEGLDLVDSTVSVTFPGRVTSSNGEVDGTTVTWRLDEVDSEFTMEAVAKDSGSAWGSAWTGISIAAAVALFMALVGFLLVVQRRLATPGQSYDEGHGQQGSPPSQR